MADALSKVRTRNTVTDQREQARPDQVKNNAGGYVFKVADEDRVLRFLTLGVQGGTYYVAEKKHAKIEAQFVLDFARDNGSRLVALLVDVSESGRAAKQNPTLFALAAVFAYGDEAAKASAVREFNRIVRTGTHLFTFISYAEQFRGWGRGLKRAVSGWFEAKDVNDLSYQLVKYRQREGWTHRDVLRSAHPRTTDPQKKILFDWVCGRPSVTPEGHAGFVGWTGPYEAAKVLSGVSIPKKAGAYAELVRANPGMTWEMLPDEATNQAEVWEALLDSGVPIGALLRQLPKLTRLGVLTGSRLQQVTAQLTDADRLRKGRVHPVKILYALKTYAQGHGNEGRSSWTPVQQVVDALDDAFYKSFRLVEPTGKRTLLAIDVSASMTWPQNMCGVLQAREGAVAMAMATAAVEQDYEIVAFSNANGWRSRADDGIERLAVSPRRRLDDNLNTVATMSAAGTDCSLPMRWAQQNKLEFDVFAIYTDNETWAGPMQPFEALRQYRQSTGIAARQVVVGMSSTGFSIADPNDPLSIDVAGFDADTPSLINGFARGDFG